MMQPVNQVTGVQHVGRDVLQYSIKHDGEQKRPQWVILPHPRVEGMVSSSVTNVLALHGDH